MIYATEYNTLSKIVVKPSIDSGFKTLNDVVKLIGVNHSFKNSRMVVYEYQGGVSTVFSKDLEFKS